MGDEGLRCRWCDVFIQLDGTCPNTNHPKRCPFCGGELVKKRMICSDSQCVSNTAMPTRRHSSFPPRLRRIDSESSLPVSEQPVYFARVLGVVLRIDHPDSELLLSDADEDDVTKTDVHQPHPTSMMPSRVTDATKESCDLIGPPTVPPPRYQSGVFLNGSSVDSSESRDGIGNARKK